jgi:hypothetical protein
MYFKNIVLVENQISFILLSKIKYMNQLLQDVLNLEQFKHFKKVSNDDYRDPTLNNSSFSISSKGWFNHSSGESGSLQSLINPSVNPVEIYQNATLEKTDLEIIKEYYLSRSIEISDFVIVSLGMRINRYKDVMSIVTPLKNDKGEIIQLHAIILNQQYQKSVPSRLRGKASDDRAILLSKGSNHVIVVEGLEDGIIIFQTLENVDVCISGGTKGFKKLSKIINKYELKSVILDNDLKDESLKFSYYLGKEIQRLIHPEKGIDANEAHSQGWFDDWYQDLKKIEYSEAVECYDKTGNLKAKDILTEMNKKHAIIRVQGKVAIMNDEFDPMFERQTVTLSSKTDFMTWYSNKYVQVENQKGETKAINIGNYWLASKDRRQYEGFVLDPLNESSPDYFNLWRGFAYEPNPNGSCEMYYDHIFNNISCKNDLIYNYTLDWLADAIQNPKNKHGISYVLRGGSGVGKGAMIWNFCKLYGIGRHAIHVNSANQVAGNFNAHLKDCLILFADEAFFAGDIKQESILKTLISEDVKTTTYKGMDSFQFPNYMRLMLASNKSWVAPLEKDDRRFFITDVDPIRQKDHKYWDKFHNEFRNESTYQKLLYDLIHRDISKSNIKDYPQTQAIIDNKVQSMDSVEQWIYDKIFHNELQDDLNINALYEDYKNGCGKAWSMNKNGWSRKLNQIFPGMIKRCQHTHEGGRYYRFNKCSELRKRFSDLYKTSFQWEAISDEVNTQKEVKF